MEWRLSLFLLGMYLRFTFQLSITACDCSSSVTHGLIDVSDPAYCHPNGSTSMETEKSIRYELLTKVRTAVTWTGYSCSQWIHTKTIIGSFWIGSYDTTYSQTVKTIEPNDCWDVVQNFRCAGNVVVKNDKTFSFVKEPTGDGAWYSIKEYSTINCVAQEITLTQETKDGPVFSPFGVVTNDSTAGHASVGSNLLVWKLPEDITKPRKCVFETVLRGVGKKSSTAVMGKIVDESQQLEILYNVTRIKICPSEIVSEVFGIPDLYIKTSTSHVRKRDIEAIYDEIPKTLLGSGRIKLLDSTKNLPHFDYFVTAQSPKANSLILSTHIDDSSNIVVQNFSYFDDTTIRVTNNPEICISSTNNRISF